MSRSIRKGPFVSESLMKKIVELNKSGKHTVIKTCPGLDHFPEMVGHTIAVHDGRKYVPIYITEEMVGHKLGNLLPLRTFRGIWPYSKGRLSL